MSKEAYNKFIKNLRINGQLFYDPDMLTLDDKAKVLTNNIFGIPATTLAENLGTQLITGDRRLYNAVSAQLPWVLWIGDYQTP